MAKHKYLYEVTINPTLDMPGFLDMLRYDAARVVNWDTTNQGTRRIYTITYTTDTPSRVERWQSFGLYPQAI